MGSIGPEKILFVLVVAMVVLGPERLPKVARDMGRFVSRLRELQARMESEVREVVGEVPEPFLNPRGWLTQQAGSILSVPGDPSAEVAGEADVPGGAAEAPSWVDDADVQVASDDVEQDVERRTAATGLANGWQGRAAGYGPGSAPGPLAGGLGAGRLGAGRLGAGEIGIVPGDPVLN
jgi:hypothetical protein